MKKDLSLIAKELFPSITQDTYKKLLYSYSGTGKTNINPKRTLNEAINKYSDRVLNIIENKDNWQIRNGNIFVDSPDYLHTIFDEFLPLYKTDDGRPYMDLWRWNSAIGEEIVYLLIVRIFYLNYTGMDIQNIDFVWKRPFSPKIIRIFLRPSCAELPEE
jgi:hypothetical protein